MLGVVLVFQDTIPSFAPGLDLVSISVLIVVDIRETAMWASLYVLPVSDMAIFSVANSAGCERWQFPVTVMMNGNIVEIDESRLVGHCILKFNYI